MAPHDAKVHRPGCPPRSVVQAPDLFAIPVLERVLLYAPLHGLAAIVNAMAARQIKRVVVHRSHGVSDHLREIVQIATSKADVPLPKSGEVEPDFLGLLPTRRCNLACRYCGFWTATEPSEDMDLQVAHDAVTWHVEHIRRSGGTHAEIHFFGGEPFCAPQILELAVPLGRRRAREAGLTVRFEAATNGAFSAELGRWAANNLDRIVLSLDGPADIQNHHRPGADGTGSFDQAVRSARIFSLGNAELSLRACVTARTVESMPDTAAWFVHEFVPTAVSFEPLQPSDRSAAAGLFPPEAWQFAVGFIQAAEILEAHGVEPVYPTADISARQVSFCPVGRDALIVSPDGTVSACYLLPRDWERRGLNLRLGRLHHSRMELDPERVNAARQLNVWNKARCQACFCRWHCAGGCHVNHDVTGQPGTYDGLCHQARIISLRNILHAMGEDNLVAEWLANRETAEGSLSRPSDLLVEAAEW